MEGWIGMGMGWRRGGEGGRIRIERTIARLEVLSSVYLFILIGDDEVLRAALADWEMFLRAGRVSYHFLFLASIAGPYGPLPAIVRSRATGTEE